MTHFLNSRMKLDCRISIEYKLCLRWLEMRGFPLKKHMSTPARQHRY